MNYCKGSENFPLNPPRDSAHDKADGLANSYFEVLGVKPPQKN